VNPAWVSGKISKQCVDAINRYNAKTILLGSPPSGGGSCLIVLVYLFIHIIPAHKC